MEWIEWFLSTDFSFKQKDNTVALTDIIMILLAVMCSTFWIIYCASKNNPIYVIVMPRARPMIPILDPNRIPACAA